MPEILDYASSGTHYSQPQSLDLPLFSIYASLASGLIGYGLLGFAMNYDAAPAVAIVAFVLLFLVLLTPITVAYVSVWKGIRRNCRPASIVLGLIAFLISCGWFYLLILFWQGLQGLNGV